MKIQRINIKIKSKFIFCTIKYCKVKSQMQEVTCNLYKTRLVHISRLANRIYPNQ